MPFLAAFALAALVQTDWKPYKLGGFQFRLPSPPVEKKIETAPKGSRYWVSMHNGKNVVVVAVSPLEPKDAGTPDAVLAAAVAGGVDGTDGALLGQADVLLSGWPGIEYRSRDGEGMNGIARVAVVGDKMVQLSVMGASEAAVKGPYELAVAGLALDKGAKAGPQKAAGPEFKAYKIGASSATVEMPREPKAEDVKLNGGATIHRFVANYGNRVYVAAYADIPEAERAKEEQFPTLLQALNDDVVGSLKGKALPSADAKLDGGYSIRTVAKVGTGGVARVESTIRDGRVYTLLAIVPSVWKDHAEPKRFFDSFKAGS